VETAAAVTAVPRTTPPVLVHREEVGTELMMEAAFSSGVCSGLLVGVCVSRLTE
jgi:hypothetical protein